MTASGKTGNQIYCSFEKALESKFSNYKGSFGNSGTLFSSHLGMVLEKRIWLSHSCQGLVVIMRETAPKSFPPENAPKRYLLENFKNFGHVFSSNLHKKHTHRNRYI